MPFSQDYTAYREKELKVTGFCKRGALQMTALFDLCWQPRVQLEAY